MISFFSIVALGFFLGMRHATDPDHVIAVTTIVSRERQISKSAWIGAFWGIGHTLTIFIVGAGIILFDLVIPPRIGLSMELAVGIMLIVLGAANVRSFCTSVPVDSESVAHSHPHRHGDYVHSHAHTHQPEHHQHTPDQTPLATLDRVLGRFKTYKLVRPLVIGVVHGLAPAEALRRLAQTPGSWERVDEP